MKLKDLETDIKLMEKKVEDAGNELLDHPSDKAAMKYAEMKRALKRMRKSLSAMEANDA